MPYLHAHNIFSMAVSCTVWMHGADDLVDVDTYKHIVLHVGRVLYVVAMFTNYAIENCNLIHIYRLEKIGML